jgi:23S rRNA pseudouridine2604 synthase
MSDPVRLAKRVAAIARCPRIEAEQSIKGGWVSSTASWSKTRRIRSRAERSSSIPTRDWKPSNRRPCCCKPAGYDAISGRNSAAALVRADTRWADDPSGARIRRPGSRHPKDRPSPSR